MKIALSGNRGSGKTTLATYLEKHHGFHVVNYTDLIKQDLALAMAYSSGDMSTHKEYIRIQQDKEFYRPLIIEWARCTGWNSGHKLHDALYFARLHDDVVVDNVRYPEQADVCKSYGYEVVRLLGGTHVDTPSERAMDKYQFHIYQSSWPQDMPIEEVYQMLRASYGFATSPA